MIKVDIETFKNMCLTDIITDQDKSKEWYDLREEQKLYGEEYIIKYKLFKGKFCSNCDTKLKREFMFRQKHDGTNHYIYKCSCGYKYADYWYENAIK